MFREITLAMAVAAVVSACAHIPTRRQLEDCGGEDKRPWKLLEELPDGVEDFRRLAQPIVTGRLAGEVWFALPSGEIMFCRVEPGRIEWWKFERTDQGIKVLEVDGWFTIYGG